MPVRRHPNRPGEATEDTAGNMAPAEPADPVVAAGVEADTERDAK